MTFPLCTLASHFICMPRGQHGNTPLHFALGMDHLQCAQLLLSHGAAVTAANKAGRTPLDEARSEAALQLLEAHLRASPATATGEGGAAGVVQRFIGSVVRSPPAAPSRVRVAAAVAAVLTEEWAMCCE